MKSRTLLSAWALLSCASLAHGSPVSLGHGPIPQEQDSENSDLPKEDQLEGMNRVFFGFNQLLDGLFLKPLAQIYDLVVADPVKDRVSDFMDNLGEPVVFVNALLQGKGEEAGRTFGRFTINSTLGVGGLFNAAYEVAGLTRHYEDFGQTLAVWGVDSGPYLVVPFLGPSSFRDLIGTAVDMAMDPVNYLFRSNHHNELPWIRTGVDAVRKRRDVLAVTDSLEKNSPDLYNSYRVLYGQTRLFQIKDGNVVYKDTPVLSED
ncbi:MAG: VacJ family lipoprotein [Proteobacteria bacterium]|nr:VacJ family lipoprotein [Pseudomonadota bacterium]